MVIDQLGDTRTRRQGYRFRLRPNGAQATYVQRTAGACRWVWNQVLDIQQIRYQADLKRLNYAETCKLLTFWRSQDATSWLSEAPIGPLQQTLRDQGRAYQNLFEGRAARPRFRKKGAPGAFRFPQPGQIELDEKNARIRLPKIGWVRYRKSRSIQGEIRNVTVSLEAGEIWMSIQTERRLAVPTHAGGLVGIDLGVARFATLSNGAVYHGPNPLRTEMARLVSLQQRLSRKAKFSRNWKKQKKRVAQTQRRIASMRNDFLHKASTEINKNHAIVVMEDLKVRNMSASAKGTPDAPGRRVRQKAGLNRAILDQGWHAFRQMLAYKTEWAGGELVVVHPAHTSRTCPECGHAAAENRPSQACFRCVACGHTAHADDVAALNIRRAGHARIACEVSGAVRPPAAGTHRSEQAAHAA